MENLISTANDKSTANNQTIINDITSLCVLAVIFSDFEIEIFFDINNFSPNFQKTILFQTINFCCDRLNLLPPGRKRYAFVYISLGL